MYLSTQPGSQRDVIISNGCLPCSLAAVEVNTTSLATVSEIITMSLRTFQIEVRGGVGWAIKGCSKTEPLNGGVV